MPITYSKRIDTNIRYQNELFLHGVPKHSHNAARVLRFARSDSR